MLVRARPAPAAGSHARSWHGPRRPLRWAPTIRFRVPLLRDGAGGLLARGRTRSDDHPVAAPGRRDRHDVGRAPQAGRATLRARRGQRPPRRTSRRRRCRIRGIPRVQERHRAVTVGSAGIPGPTGPTHPVPLAAGTDRRVLVRLGPQVQAVLPTTRPGHSVRRGGGRPDRWRRGRLRPRHAGRAAPGCEFSAAAWIRPALQPGRTDGHPCNIAGLALSLHGRAPAGGPAAPRSARRPRASARAAPRRRLPFRPATGRARGAGTAAPRRRSTSAGHRRGR